MSDEFFISRDVHREDDVDIWELDKEPVEEDGVFDCSGSFEPITVGLFRSMFGFVPDPGQKMKVRFSIEVVP